MAIVDITVENDADFYRLFQYVQASNLAPVNITGASMEMMLHHAEDVTALLRLATDTGEIVITDPLNGLFYVLIAQLTLEQLDLGVYDHSNVMTLNGMKTKVWSGTLTNNAGPTR